MMSVAWSFEVALPKLASTIEPDVRPAQFVTRRVTTVPQIPTTSKRWLRGRSRSTKLFLPLLRPWLLGAVPRPRWAITAVFPNNGLRSAERRSFLPPLVGGRVRARRHLFRDVCRAKYLQLFFDANCSARRPWCIRSPLGAPPLPGSDGTPPGKPRSRNETTRRN